MPSGALLCGDGVRRAARWDPGKASKGDPTTTTSLAGIPEKAQGQRRLLTVQIPTRQALYQTALRALSQRSHCAEIVRQGHCAQSRDGEPCGSGDVAGYARVGRTSTCASISAAHTGFGSCSLRLHPRASHDNSASSSSPTQRLASPPEPGNGAARHSTEPRGSHWALALPDRDVRTRIYLVVLAPEKNCGDNRSHDTAPSELIS